MKIHSNRVKNITNDIGMNEEEIGHLRNCCHNLLEDNIPSLKEA